MGEATSTRQLARECGVNASTACRWLKRADFPLHKEPPWSSEDVADIKAWQTHYLQADRAADDYEGNTDKDHWNARRYRAMALEAEGRLVPIDKVERLYVRSTAEFSERMEQVGPAVAPLCVGKSVSEIEQIITEATTEVIEDIASRLGDASSSLSRFGEWLEALNEAEEPDAEQMGDDETPPDSGGHG